ncbi:MAG: DUF2007 domain-containing protein [bacterium]|nr:DUF2007 domain-containing protein [bacterium]
MNQFVTIKTFTYAYELAVLKGRLESEGISCFIKNENFSQIASIYSNAIGGIQLQVRENDIPIAIEILREGDYLNDKDYEALKNYHSEKIVHHEGHKLVWFVEYKGIIIAALILALVFFIWYLLFAENNMKG